MESTGETAETNESSGEVELFRRLPKVGGEGERSADELKGRMRTMAQSALRSRGIERPAAAAKAAGLPGIQLAIEAEASDTPEA